MTIEYAFVIAEPNQVGSAALVGKFLHEATSIYHSFMVFDGPRQLYEADLLGLLEKTSARENAQCVVIAILSPFDVTPFPGEPAAAGSGAPSAETAFLLAKGTLRERSSPCCHCRPRFLVPTPLRCRSDKKRRSRKLPGLGLRRDLSQTTNRVSRSGRVDPRFWTLNTSVTPPASHETRTVSPERRTSRSLWNLRSSEWWPPDIGCAK